MRVFPNLLCCMVRVLVAEHSPSDPWTRYQPAPAPRQSGTLRGATTCCGEVSGPCAKCRANHAPTQTAPRLTQNGSGVDGGGGTDTTVGRHTGLHAVGMGLERRSTWARQHLEGAGRSMQTHLEQTVDTTDGELQAGTAGPGRGLLLVVVEHRLLVCSHHHALGTLACERGAAQGRVSAGTGRARARGQSMAPCIDSPDRPLAPLPDMIAGWLGERRKEERRRGCADGAAARSLELAQARGRGPSSIACGVWMWTEKSAHDGALQRC